MTTNTVVRTYRLTGLDRFLYDPDPVWPEGTFRQIEVDAGDLILTSHDVDSPSALTEAVSQADLTAQRFRLAISRRTGCPLKLRLTGFQHPSFNVDGTLLLQSSASVSDVVWATVHPRQPPAIIEQLHLESDRWVTTLTESRGFSQYADEVLKRLFLLIEEFEQDAPAVLDAVEVAKLSELKHVRNFVSHPICERIAVCQFIAARLSSAVVSTSPLVVRFDRTNVEHRNFVGSFEPDARSIANKLLDAAIGRLA